MNYTIHSFGLAALIVFTVMPLRAQHSEIAMRRLVLDEALTTIENYEAMATIGDGEVYYDFLELFTSRDVLVYNDLLGVSGILEMPVSEYADKMKTGMRNKIVSVRNVTTERPHKGDDGTWRVSLTFDKSVSYSNACGVLFSSNEFYGVDYRLTATLRYDDVADKCQIERIIGSVANERRMPDTYFVFKRTDKRDKELRYYGEEPIFNSYDQAFLRGTFSEMGFVYPDLDVDLLPSQDECGIATMKYKVHKLRLKGHYDIVVGDVFGIGDEADGLGKSKSTATTMGLELGYSFLSEGKLRTALFFGVGMEQSKIDLSYNSSDFFFSSDADVDRDNYIRHYEGLSLAQTLKLTDLVIPVYLDFSFTTNRLLSVYANLGVRVDLNMSHSIDKTSGTADVYGIYPQYDDLRLDANWGYNGFGEHYYGSQDLITDELDGVAGSTLDLMAAAGFRVSIPHTPLAIDWGFGYQRGLMNVFSYDGKPVGFGNGAANPVVYNSISGLNSTERLHNLSEGIGSLKRNALKLNLGLILKL